MKITPVKGTNDYTPEETRVRDFLQAEILRTYLSCGFERITTPILEDIENLDKSDGGENLNLIFKVLKRGDKLTKSIEEGKYNELSDIGLRYDLTLPLSRYYANNRAKLTAPFKVIQMDRVFRAERPQKGRLREFMQCDIDIIGTTSAGAEIELVHTTAKALINIGIKNFKVKLNDRRILKEVLLGTGFLESELDSVCISFDKLDKLKAEGVKEELMEKGFAASKVSNLMNLLSLMPITMKDVKLYCEDKAAAENLEAIIAAVTELSDGAYQVEYDLSLVRGQGYYTGTVFEMESIDFKGAIAGGGRYDNLIGKFLNESVPAVGFSIGFERITGILLNNKYQIPDQRKRIAILYSEDEVTASVRYAEELRIHYDAALFPKPKKIGKFLERLKEQGFFGFYIMGKSEALELFDT